MSNTSDSTAENDGTFDSREAAALLDQTTQRARRQFAPGSPQLWAFRAFMVLIGLGGCWLSSRNQQPYSGPTAPAYAVLFALVAINVGWSSWSVKRSAGGVSGPAQQTWRLWAGGMLGVLVIAFTVIASAYHPGATTPVWALYPLSGAMMVVGIIGAIASGLLRYRSATITLVGITVVCVIAGFAGPAGEWLITGIGMCAVCLVAAVSLARQERRSLVRS
jgi:hypothetical protein